MKALLFLLLLGALAGMLWRYPFLFEIALLGAIGGAYWLFFRSPTPASPSSHSADKARREEPPLP